MLASSCSSTRNFSEGQSLLKNYQIKGVNANLKEKITPFIRQKPNKKLFGISKVSLHLHQLFDRKKPTKLSNWIINNLGEPPVIYDSTLARISVIQIQQLLLNNGYFLAKVKY